jgi:hypothetical protein
MRQPQRRHARIQPLVWLPQPSVQEDLHEIATFKAVTVAHAGQECVTHRCFCFYQNWQPLRLFNFTVFVAHTYHESEPVLLRRQPCLAQQQLQLNPQLSCWHPT